MKKIIKKILLFVITFLFLIISCPSNIYALTETTDYIGINNKQNLEVGNLSFKDISFKDYSSTSTQAFGLTGIVTNSANKTINYTATIYYYDSNYKLIAQGYNSGNAISGTSNFNQMFSLKILGEHNVSEIYYYRLSINENGNSKSIVDSANLTPSKNSKYKSYDYVIDKYDVNIDVKENNTFDITETIIAYFNIPKHGIFRTIPLKNTITRLDGTKSTNRTQITNIYVNEKYTSSKKDGYYKLQIGSKDNYVFGEQKYVIKYTYNLGKDPVKNYDELYYNIIGNEWDTVIGNVTFSITMPKQFDSSKLGFSSGLKGSTNNSNVIYNVSGNKITGNYNGILNAKEALTVRCELPEGYFVDAGLTINMMNYIGFLIPIIFLVISIILWYKFGRDEQVVETVEFYPPQGFNSLEVGFLYKGYADEQDVTSLLIYLANKGYLEIIDKKTNLDSEIMQSNQKYIISEKIIELQNKINQERFNNPNSQIIPCYEDMLNTYKLIENSSYYEYYDFEALIDKLDKENGFVVRKLRDYDGTNIYERLFMEGLFERGRTEVTDKMLYNNFYVTNNAIVNGINNIQNLSVIFENPKSKKSVIILLMIIATYCLITIPPALMAGEHGWVFYSFALLFPAVKKSK